jgi:hypothetical protein
MGRKNGSSHVKFLGCIPHQIEADWDDKWGPLLAGFPLNIQYAAVVPRWNKEPAIITALYEPDLDSFRETETTRKMTYFNTRGGDFRVEVALQKGSSRLDTFKYEGEKLIAEATGSDFDSAMLQTTMIGMQKTERVRVIY